MINTISLHLYEDAEIISDSDKLLVECDIPREEKIGGTCYMFEWHSQYNLDNNALRLNSKNNFNDAALSLSEMTEPAILFFDLHINGDNFGNAVEFNWELITPQIYEWIQQLAIASDCEEVTNIEDAVRFITDGDRGCGLLLALIASANTQWQGGVIAFASNRSEINVKTLNNIINLEAKIIFLNAEGSLATTAYKQRARRINDAINKFIESRQGPSFWQTGTDQWFKPKKENSNEGNDDETAPSHDPIFDSDSQKNLIKSYLQSLLKNQVLPETWFTDNKQYKILFEVLKSYLGVDSVCEGNKSKNLRLGALPLLTAAWMAHENVNIDWFMEYRWEQRGASGVEIMTHKSSNDAKKAVLELGRWLQVISTDDNTRMPLVKKVEFNTVFDHPEPQHLLIDLDFNPIARNGHSRSLLQGLMGINLNDRIGGMLKVYMKMIDAVRGCEMTPSEPAMRFSIYPISATDECNNSVLWTRLDFAKK